MEAGAGGRVLVLNRGEIALRACTAARALGLTPVLFVTPADLDALPTRSANDLYVCDHSDARRSFLSLEEVARAIHATRADWVYPGYGFLSETEELCLAVEEAGAGFVGPRASTLRTTSHKSLALDLARRAGIADLSLPLRVDVAGRTLPPDHAAYPILLKAAKGGGGRGNVRVASAAEFDGALARLRERSRELFADDEVIAERYLPEARHVELQIFGIRGHGVRLLGTRDCSLQRNFQKLIEEGPAPETAQAALAPLVPALLRELEALGYEGAGTVELLWDEAVGRAYFIEINPRIQVEHTVTELLIGEDLIEWQLREAVGLARDALFHRAISERGHAVQARIYAEDPLAGFSPDSGVATLVDLPPRRFCSWDAGVASGATISPHYDALLAKLVVSAPTRDLALQRLSACLREATVHGVKTNLSFLTDLVDHEVVRRDEHHVRFVEDSFMPEFADAERARTEAFDLGEGSALASTARLLRSKVTRDAPHNARGRTWKLRHRA
jgi:acetyl/propionyl-CoA carboxylase alpha subunit